MGNFMNFSNALSVLTQYANAIKNRVLYKDSINYINKDLSEYKTAYLYGFTGSFSLISGSGSSIVASLTNNTEYKVRKKTGQGDRFRVILFENYPTATPTASAIELINDNNADNFSFNSGNYNYAVLTYCSGNIASIDQNTAEAVIRLASVPDNTELMTWTANSYLGAKNLLPSNGGTSSICTTNDDGTVTVNGTPTSDLNFTVSYNKSIKLPKGRYRLSGCPAGGSDVSPQTYRLRLGVDDNPHNWGTFVVNDLGEGAIFEVLNESQYYAVNITIFANYQASNLVFKPMITRAEDTDLDYRPYSLTNQELTNKTYTVDDALITSLADQDAIPVFQTAAYKKQILWQSIKSILGSIFNKTAITWVTTNNTHYQKLSITENGLTAGHEIHGSKYMELTQDISTAVGHIFTFSNSAITVDSVIDYYTSDFAVQPTNVSVAAGTCAVTVPQASSSKNLTVRIYIK